MSLTIEQFIKAQKRREEMDERLKVLLGFNPATSDHYGIIRLYNERIDSNTLDEKIIEIRSDFIRWRNEISALFAENNFALDDEQLGRLFSVDPMYGTINFLNIEVDIHKGAKPFGKAIMIYIKRKKRE